MGAVSKTIILVIVAIYVSIANAQTTTSVFSNTKKSIEEVSLQAKNSSFLNEKNRTLFTSSSIDAAHLSSLRVNDKVTLNLPANVTSATVLKIYDGASGSRHIVLRSEINGTLMSSVVTIGETDVFMDLATKQGYVTAIGDRNTVLLHNPTALRKTLGVNGKDFIVPNIALNNAANTEQPDVHSHLEEKTSEISNAFSDTETNTDIATIDIFFVYSSNVHEVINDINTRVDHLIAYANQAFEDSGIFIKLRFKGILEVDYPYNDGRTALYAIRDGEPPFENVKKHWGESGADAVALLTPQVEWDGSAGIAFKLGHLTSNSASMMYSQSDVDSGASTFAHEIGHNLGLGHSRPQGNIGSDFDHGVGYRISAPDGAGFNTIMSYSAQGAYHEVPLFSTPSKLCGDFACGVSKTDKDYGADAVHAVNAVRHIVAGYGEGDGKVISINDALTNVVDASLAACIQDEAADKVFFAHQLRYLYCSSTVTSLNGLEQFTALNSVYLGNAIVDDLSPIKELTKLTRLTLNDVQAVDFSALVNLRSLQILELRTNTFTTESAEFLLSFPELRQLNIQSDSVSSLPNLSELALLENVRIEAPVTSLTSIAQNRNLRTLYVYSDSIVFPQTFDWPLLTQLSLSGGAIPNFSLLSTLESLNELTLTNMALSDISGLGQLENLSKLDISYNQVTDISELQTLPRLVSLDISENPIGNMEVVSELTSLQTLRAGQFGESYNWSFVSDFAELKELSITSVDTATINAISNLSGSLTNLNLFEVDAKDLSPLFNFYKLGSMSINPVWGVEFYCWQADYLRGIPEYYGNVYNFSCDSTQDEEDFDGDGVSNRGELNRGSNPIENDNAPSIIEFLDTKVTVHEQGGSAGLEYFGVVRRTGNSLDSTSFSLTNSDISTDHSDYRFYDNSGFFNIGDNATRFSVFVKDDDLIEDTETLSLSLSDITNAEQGPNDTLTIEIKDNVDGSDFIDNSVGISGATIGWESLYTSVSEAEEQVSLLLNRPTGLQGEFSVELQAIPLTDGTVGSFTIDQTVLRFAPEDDVKSITVRFEDDDTFKSAKYIALRLFNAENVSVDPYSSATTLVITDDEAEGRKIEFAQTSFNVDESDEFLELIINREGNDIVPRKFTIYKTSGEISLGKDIVLPKTEFTMLPDETEKKIRVSITDDSFYEGHESIQLGIKGLPFEAAGPNWSTFISINDNDSRGNESGRVSFSEPTSTTQEPISTYQNTHYIEIVRDGDLSDTLTVRYSMEEVSASRNDFSNYSRQVVFEPGQRSRQIGIDIYRDDIAESNEEFLVHLSADTDHLGDLLTHTVTIENGFDSGTGVVSVKQFQLVTIEGSPAQMVLIRDGDISGPREIELTFSDIETTSDDYIEMSDTIFFAPGEVTKVVSINTVDDARDELIETFTVSLSSEDYAAIGTPSYAEISIIDNDKPKRTQYDYDGDDISDIVIRRPSIGQFIVARSSDNAIMRTYFGSLSDDIPLAGDFDGDGITDIAIRRESAKQFISRTSSDDKINRLFFGSRDEDIPVVADYDGDGIDDIAVRRPSTGQWFIKQSSTSAIIRETFGLDRSDVPVVADYDGDGKADIAVRRQNAGQYIIKYSSNGEIKRIGFGSQSTDIAVPADYDGDGKADIAVRRPSDGFWYIKRSSDNVIERIYFGSQADDIPVVADYDGDGIADVAIRRPSTGNWIVRQSSDGSYMRLYFGSASSDIPIAAPLTSVLKMTDGVESDRRIAVEETFDKLLLDNEVKLFKERLAPKHSWETIEVSSFE